MRRMRSSGSTSSESMPEEGPSTSERLLTKEWNGSEGLLRLSRPWPLEESVLKLVLDVFRSMVGSGCKGLVLVYVELNISFPRAGI